MHSHSPVKTIPHPCSPPLNTLLVLCFFVLWHANLDTVLEVRPQQCSAVQCRSLCSPARPCSVHVREVMRAVKPSGFYQLPQIKPAQLLASKVYCRNCQKNKTIMAERQAQLTMGFPVSLLHGDLKSLYCFGRNLCAGSSLQRHMLTCVT